MVSALQLPPPKNWQDLETLARDLWRAIWGDPNTTKNGRSGQAQHGVDIYGRPGQGSKWAGVQCKGKDDYPGGELTENELRAEVEKAKHFKPALSSWILATSAKKDANLEEVARKITADHVAAGLFSVNIWFWSDIQDELANYPDVARRHYSNSFYNETSIEEILENTRELVRRAQPASAELSLGATETVELTGIDISNDVVSGEYQAEIKFAHSQIEDFKPGMGKALLLELRSRIWDAASDEVKYSLSVALGFAHYKLGEYSDAQKAFGTAIDIKPDNSNANANLAIAFQSQGDFKQADKYAKKAIKLDAVNVNAHVVLLNLPAYRGISKAEKVIPDALRQDPGILHNLGWIAFNSGDVDLAIKYFELAVASDPKRHPEILATLGQFLLPNEWDFLSGRPFDIPTHHQRIQRGIALLTEAIDKARGTDLETSHATWWLNRGIGERFLGDFDAAVRDIDYALHLKPDRAEFIKHRALIELMRKQWALAEILLQKIKSDPDTPDAVLMLADSLIFQGKRDDAIRELNEFLSTPGRASASQAPANLLIRLNLEEDRLSEAERVLAEFFPLTDKSIRALVNRARIQAKRGKTAKAKSLLRQAKKKIRTNTRPPAVLDLAHEFASLGEYIAAADCLSHVSDDESDNEGTRLRVENFYLGGMLSKTIEICKDVRAKNGAVPYFADVEIAAYEEIGDYRSAIKVCEAKLIKNPKDWYTDLRIAWFSYCLLDDDYPREFLKKRVDFSKVPIDLAPKLAHLYGVFGESKLGIKLMYEVRQRHFDNADAHLCYASVFFDYERRNPGWLDQDAVSVGAAVEIADPGGKTQWYEIVDADAQDLKNNKIGPDHALAKRLLGKKVGDSVQIGPDGSPGTRTERITQIKSKYLFALHETMENFERMFPESGSLRQIYVGNAEDPEEFAEHSPKFFEVISKHQERRERIAQIYRQRHLTIGAFANLQGRSSLEAWQFLSNNPRSPVYVSTGSPDEFQAVAEELNKTPRLVADLTSIALASDLKLGEVMVAKFGKIRIAQATLTALLHQRNELAARRTEGFSTVGKIDGKFYFQDFGPDYIQDRVRDIDSLLNWCRSYCEISPYLSGLDGPRQRRESLREALRPEFYDTLQIAGAPGNFLLSEDYVLRALAVNEYNIRCGATQPLLQFLEQSGVISHDEYIEAIANLSGRCLEFIQVNAETLTRAAAHANWKLTPRFRLTLAKIGQKGGDVGGLVTVAFNFMAHVCGRPLSKAEKRRLLIATLIAIGANYEDAVFLPSLVRILQYRAMDFPNESELMIETIERWMSLKRIIPFWLI
jgi:tetratricopeptide (TPR) repeat protein